MTGLEPATSGVTGRRSIILYRVAQSIQMLKTKEPRSQKKAIASLK